MGRRAARMMLRHEEPVELLPSMEGHCGTCRHCGGVVKMRRSHEDGSLLPEQCHCFGCGQRYRMEVIDIEAWEADQWLQKARKWGA